MRAVMPLRMVILPYPAKTPSRTRMGSVASMGDQSMSKIGLDHDRVTANILWQSLRNDAAFRQDQNSRAQRHDEFHLVFDHDKSGVAFGVIGLQSFAQMPEHGRIH